MSHVRDFGGVGDGKTDDTSALVHALKHHDGRLLLDGGRYRITRTVEIDLASVGPICLDGGNTGAIVMAGSGPALRLVGRRAGSADPRHTGPLTWSRLRGPLVHGLEIMAETPDADGIELQGCWQPNLVGLVIHDVRHGVRLVERNRNLIVDRCHIYHNTGSGLFFDRVNLHQTNITGCHISYNRLGGIRIEAAEIRNLQITGNDIEYNNAASHPDRGGGEVAPTAEIFFSCEAGGSIREVTISGNTIQATASILGANIRLIGHPTADHLIGMLTLSGNLIGSQETNLWFQSCRGITLSGNYIYGAENRNVLMQDCSHIVSQGNCIGANPDYRTPVRQVGVELAACRHVMCTGDQLTSLPPYDREQVAAGFRPAKALIELRACRGVRLTGLQFVDAFPAAVFVDAGEDIWLSHCGMADDNAPTGRRHALIWQGAGSRNLVEGCRFLPGSAGLHAIDDRAQVALDADLRNP